MDSSHAVVQIDGPGAFGSCRDLGSNFLRAWGGDLLTGQGFESETMDVDSKFRFGISVFLCLMAQRIRRVRTSSSSPKKANKSYATLTSLPKVELHIHLDGALSNELLWNHLTSSPSIRSRLPRSVTLGWDPDNKLNVAAELDACKSFTEFSCLCTCKGERSLNAMLKCFEIFSPIVRGDENLLEMNAYEFVKKQKVRDKIKQREFRFIVCACLCTPVCPRLLTTDSPLSVILVSQAQNVIYTEVRYSPHFLATASTGTQTGILGGAAKAVVSAVTKGLRRGCKETGVMVNQILCCINWRPEWADETVELAHEFSMENTHNGACRVVGVDIAAGEEHFDSVAFPALHEPHLKAMIKAKKLGLPITLHAGENADPENIRKAVDKYGARRIGHGYRAADDCFLMGNMSDKGVHFEVCPTSR